MKFLAFIAFTPFIFAAYSPPDNKQFAYAKAVICKYNPKLLANVSCFAKSYSRAISTLNIFAIVKERITSVMMDFILQYKYGTIYRDVLHSAGTFDFCYWMDNLSEFRKRPLANEFIKVLDESFPGCLKPCPWKEIRALNVTLKTDNFASIWPSGDYKVKFLMRASKEDYLNITFVGNFRTPLKETFG